MDANKAEKLREIKYSWSKTCGNCRYSHIRQASDYGECQKFTYQHEKHSSSTRQLSIHQHGTCPSWKESENYLLSIQSFVF